MFTLILVQYTVLSTIYIQIYIYTYIPVLPTTYIHIMYTHIPTCMCKATVDLQYPITFVSFLEFLMYTYVCVCTCMYVVANEWP